MIASGILESSLYQPTAGGFLTCFLLSSISVKINLANYLSTLSSNPKP